MSKGIDDYDVIGNDWYINENDVNVSQTVFENNTFQETPKTTYNKSWLTKNKVNNEAVVSFIGDSVLDNKAYTKTGKSTVDYVIDSFDNKRINFNDQSIDGYTIYDCVDTNKVNDKSDAVVISAGGNDLLASMPLLGVTDDTNITMGLMNSELDKFMYAYETMLNNLRRKGRKFLLVTCYNGNLAYNPTRFNSVDNSSLAIVSMWNDRLYSLANRLNSYPNTNLGQSFDVLDTRNFMSVKCYYNEIEPNERGAKRIAKHITRWINHNGVL